MSYGLNMVQAIGNVGQDPEMRYTPQGSAVTTFSVAVNRRWTGQDGQPQEETEWFNVVAWDKLAETCNELIQKGRKVYVQGRQRTNKWEKDGQKHIRTELVAQQVIMLDARPGGQEQGEYDEDLDDVEAPMPPPQVRRVVRGGAPRQGQVRR